MFAPQRRSQAQPPPITLTDRDEQKYNQALLWVDFEIQKEIEGRQERWTRLGIILNAIVQRAINRNGDDPTALNSWIGKYRQFFREAGETDFAERKLRKELESVGREVKNGVGMAKRIGSRFEIVDDFLPRAERDDAIRSLILTGTDLLKEEIRADIDKLKTQIDLEIRINSRLYRPRLEDRYRSNLVNYIDQLKRELNVHESQTEAVFAGDTQHLLKVLRVVRILLHLNGEQVHFLSPLFATKGIFERMNPQPREGASHVSTVLREVSNLHTAGGRRLSLT